MKKNRIKKRHLSLIAILCTTLCGRPATAQVNYDESKVPDYVLPQLLGSGQGTVQTWEEQRRPELLKLCREQVYGRMPEGEVQVDFQIIDEDRSALGGRAVRRQVKARFSRNGKNAEMSILIYLPAEADGPVPLFLGLNFFGNHTIHPDDQIGISEAWVPNHTLFCIDNHRADEVSRGVRTSRWPVERLLARGYGLATVYAGDIDPDFDDGFKNGIHALFQPAEDGATDSWSTISAWAWGLSRAMDYLLGDPDVDAERVAVIGHSRLGKAALWAGASDERFAMVISNNSGCAGAALSRRRFGETVARINQSFPHWFCANFSQYNDKEDNLPVDQHQLLALMVPRPLYVASAVQDEWADPRGEYLSLYHASEVYRLYDPETELPEVSPAVNQPLHRKALGYHLRSGDHDITRYDWERYMDFADHHFND